MFRMQKRRHAYGALKWSPSGQKQTGKPRKTWKRMIEKETEVVSKKWNDFKILDPGQI